MVIVVSEDLELICEIRVMSLTRRLQQVGTL